MTNKPKTWEDKREQPVPPAIREAIERHKVTRQFTLICEDNQELFSLKNTQYGNAIEETGVLGATVEIIGVVARLRQLVLRAKDHGRSEREAIENVARDAHNYANILMLMLQTDNWEGISSETEVCNHEWTFRSGDSMDESHPIFVCRLCGGKYKATHLKLED